MPQRTAIVNTALALRRTHPLAPAADVLALAMKGQQALPTDFGADGTPPTEFALLVAEAFDEAMTPGEWRAWTQPEADAKLRAALLVIWAVDVRPRFVRQFSPKP